MKKKVYSKKKSTSLDGLAVMVQSGFTDMQERMLEKPDFMDFKSKAEQILYAIDGKLQSVDQRLDAIEKTLGPLVHVTDALGREYRHLETRIARLEHKAGLHK